MKWSIMWRLSENRRFKGSDRLGIVWFWGLFGQDGWEKRWAAGARFGVRCDSVGCWEPSLTSVVKKEEKKPPFRGGKRKKKKGEIEKSRHGRRTCACLSERAEGQPDLPAPADPRDDDDDELRVGDVVRRVRRSVGRRWRRRRWRRHAGPQVAPRLLALVVWRHVGVCDVVFSDFF